jgi:hypothetical protein
MDNEQPSHEGFLHYAWYADTNAEEKRFRRPRSSRTQAKDDKMRERTPNMTDFCSFNCMRPGQHLSFLELHVFPFSHVASPGLRIKTLNTQHVHFSLHELIINIIPLEVSPLA